MRVQYLHMNTLSDSREIMEAKPYKASVYGTYLIVSLIVSVFIWMACSEMDTVVKARAVLRPSDDIGTVTATVSGDLVKALVEDGQGVTKGQTLFQLDTVSKQLQYDLYKSELTSKKETLQLKKTYIKAIQENRNLFKLETSVLEDQYYYQFENAMHSKNQVIESVNGMLFRLNEQKEVAKGYQALVSAHGRGSFSAAGSIYTSEYASFNSQLAVLKESLEAAKTQFENAKVLLASLSISVNEYKSYESNLTKAQSALDVHLSATKVVWQKQEDAARAQMMMLESEIRKLMPSALVTGVVNDRQYISQMMETLNQELLKITQEVTVLEQQTANLLLEIKQGVLTANQEGVVSFSQPYASGDFIQAGTTVARVIPTEQAVYKVELIVPNRDISDINLGDTVNFRFDALPHKEYGMLSGTITRIGTDANLNADLGQSYYIVEASLKNQPLYSYKGTEAFVKIGMTLEAQVVTESKNVLKWALEKINILD